LKRLLKPDRSRARKLAPSREILLPPGSQNRGEWRESQAGTVPDPDLAPDMPVLAKSGGWKRGDSHNFETNNLKWPAKNSWQYQGLALFGSAKVIRKKCPFHAGFLHADRSRSVMRKSTETIRTGPNLLQFQ
jgi:hypothetical protein